MCQIRVGIFEFMSGAANMPGWFALSGLPKIRSTRATSIALGTYKKIMYDQMCICNEPLSLIASAILSPMCQRSSIKLDNYNHVIAHFAKQKTNKTNAHKNAKKAKNTQHSDFPAGPPR